MDKENVEQGQGRDTVQEKIERIKEERSFHLQIIIINGKSKTGIERSVHTQSTI
jgi:hypothetical protein